MPRRLAIVILPLIALACAAVETARRSFTEDEDNPQLWANRAAFLDQAGEIPTEAWRRAAALAPREALYRSRLGLAEEAAGDLGAAERDLKSAAELSRKFEPHWNLLNFYFRRGRWNDFWKESRVALGASYGDRTPLFDLLTRAEGGAPELPPDRAIRVAYASFLLSHSDSRALPAIEELASSADAEDLPTFRSWIDSFVAARNTAAAARIWTILQRRGLLHDDPFPWRAHEIAGATIHERAPGAWQIILSGEQPEQCDLLSRIVPAARGSQVCVRADSHPALPAGVAWRTEPYDADSVRVILTYRRPLGSTRAEGSFEIGKVAIGDCQ